MANLRWYEPLERCATLDGIRTRWQALLEQNQMSPANPAPRYQDALLSFLGTSTLPAHLKLAAVLALGSAFDFDLRLALGALAGQTTEWEMPWPGAVDAAVSDNGAALQVDTNDSWLRAFVAGRLAGLRETLTHDGTGASDWRAAFWNRYLEMACRHGSLVHVRLALDNGADPRAGDYAAVTAAAKGPDHASGDRVGDDPRGPSDVDYGRVLSLLIDNGLPAEEALTAALPAAASAGNTAMLDVLLALGADIQADGTSALEAAAGHLSLDALDWLLGHGAVVDGADGAVLDAAVSTLDETMIEAVLAAGADPGVCGDRVFCTALATQPWDLYSAETDFDAWRPAVIALLLRHGARPEGAAVVDALRTARDPIGVVDEAGRLVEPGNDGIERFKQLALHACGQQGKASMSRFDNAAMPGHET